MSPTPLAGDFSMAISFPRMMSLTYLGLSILSRICRVLGRLRCANELGIPIPSYGQASAAWDIYSRGARKPKRPAYVYSYALSSGQNVWFW